MTQDIKQTAEEWWDVLTEDKHIVLLKEYGLYGHDEGITMPEIKWIYEQEHKTQ